MIDKINGELVSFFSTDGLRLNGFLCKPKKKSDKVILHVHGIRGNFYRSLYMKLFAKEAVKNNFNFFTIEQRGSYNSTKIPKKGRKYTSVLGGGSFEKFEDCIYDISGAIKLLKSLGMTKIYLEGHSTGCQKITYYQYKKKNRNVKALLLLAPADDYNLQKRELGKKFSSVVKKAKVLYKKNKNTMMPEPFENQFSVGRFLSFSDLKFVESRIFNYDLPKLKEFGSIKIPVLAVFGSREQYALKPIKTYMKILEKNTNSRKFDYIIIKGANHGFDTKEKELVEKSMNWIKKLY